MKCCNCFFSVSGNFKNRGCAAGHMICSDCDNNVQKCIPCGRDINSFFEVKTLNIT